MLKSRSMKRRLAVQRGQTVDVRHAPVETCIRFDMSDPDARAELGLALGGPRLRAFVWDLLQELRNAEKYGSGFGIKSPGVASISGWCYDELNERGLTELVES